MEEPRDVEHTCEVILLSEEGFEAGSSILAALRDNADDRLAVCEFFLNGESLVDNVRHPPEKSVVVISHHDLAYATGIVRDLRRRGAHQPILLVTPEQDLELILRAYKAGANDCVDSAISPALLRAKIRVWRRWSGTPLQRAIAAHLV